jgi:imidazolonepropionase-like amidohydrolase
MTMVPMQTSARSSERFAVRAARLFDGVSRAVRNGPLVVIEGDRVVSVADGGPAPDGVPVLDLGDVTLMPGLIDTHVHLAFDASQDPVASLAARDDPSAISSMKVAATTAARGGVTTLRDLGDRDYLSLDMRELPGLPTVVCAGPPITTPSGHCHYLGGAAEPGAAGMRRAVREHAERGVDVIKVMASGGHLTEGTDPARGQFTLEELRAAVDEAHACDLPVTAHAHAPESVALAVQADVDGLEHATFWTEEGVDAPAKTIRDIGDRGIVVGASAGFVLDGNRGLDADFELRLPGIIDVMQRLHQAGAKVVPGTDAGINPTKPHDVVRHALEQMVALLGIPPFEALLTATSQAAEICGLGHRKGRVAPGYDADLVAVGGRPLTDISHIHDIRAVYVRGTEVTR